ncbi:MAG: metallophosphoesterase [Clostridia bacterium]|nr:metallophosphoesterase [Clostridia bacterium]
MKIKHYAFETDKLRRSLRIALVSDLHSREPLAVIEAVGKIKPDIICIAGDLTEALDGSMDGKNEYGFAALRALCAIAPTFYAPGNHEIAAYHLHHHAMPLAQPDADRITPENRARIAASGAHFLENTCIDWKGILIGGLGSGMLEQNGKPKLYALDEFFNHKGFKILICHHPEYYPKYLRDRDVDLILSGHAHGGQWRLFGRGLYAPDQGLFPKYTSGVHEDRLVISKGTANTGGIIPRLFNPREVVCITINEREDRV